jgi:bacterial/archaeal transporter family-2 protein
VAIFAGSPAARSGLRQVRTAVHERKLRGWYLTGGLCGALVVTSQTLTVATLGVAVFTVALVAGQSVASLAVDRAGIGPGGREPVTAVRLLGAGLSIVAVAVALANRLGAAQNLALIVLPLVAGLGSAWQIAVNGRVRRTAESTTTATFVNFAAGTSALALVVAVRFATGTRVDGHLPHTWWSYTGGLIGLCYIAVAAEVVRYTGVLLLSLATVGGQLIGALVLDEISPSAAGRPGLNTVIGVLLMLVAIGIATVGRRINP